MVIKLCKKRDDEDWLKLKIRQDFDNVMNSTKGANGQRLVYSECIERCRNWSFDDLLKEIKSDYEFVINK
jgi:hypothetical protein